MTPHSSAQEARQRVATPASDTKRDSARCGRCGRPIERPRPRQKACSSRCRFALWKAEQDRRVSGLDERHRRAYELLEEALRLLRAPLH